jgi:hypothetical protein
MSSVNNVLSEDFATYKKIWGCVSVKQRGDKCRIETSNQRAIRITGVEILGLEF